jgi:hypothetical protein
MRLQDHTSDQVKADLELIVGLLPGKIESDPDFQRPRWSNIAGPRHIG